MPKFAPVDWKTLERVFLAAGFRFARQEGSHHSYLRQGVARPVVMPTYAEVPVFIIRNNLKTAGISRDEYFRLLEQGRWMGDLKHAETDQEKRSGQLHRRLRHRRVA